MMKRRLLLPLYLLSAALCLLTDTAVADTDRAARAATALQDYYQQHHAALNTADFDQPLQLHSEILDHTAEGEVLTVLATPFPLLATSLSQAGEWCELAILHVNIKSCWHSASALRLFVGRKEYQSPEAAHEIRYAFDTVDHTADYLRVRMSAPRGPLGTHDYLILLEAVALDDTHSVVRLRYRYGFGTLARLAMNTYLATVARDKIGFTVTGHDEQGEPIYIGGMQGVVERNVMRYLIAIQSLLDNHSQRITGGKQGQFEQWYRYTSRHPRQLMELSRQEYLQNKQREWQNQHTLQADLQLATQQSSLYY